MRRLRSNGWELAGAAVLLGCVGLYVWFTRGWPLVNDPALMSYVVLLMGKGLAPYREIGDINFPGAYVPEWASMGLAHLLHAPEAAVWRGMDFLALALAAWAMVRIARPWNWFAGIWAGCLFALYHGRDGMGQAGQRDLWMTVLLLWAVAALLTGSRGRRVGCFGLLVGTACTVKPVAAPFLLLLLPTLWKARGAWPRMRLALWAGAGFCFPLLAVFLFLEHWGAVSVFWQVLRVLLPYHASLGDGSLSQLLRRSTLPSLGKLLLFLFAIELLRFPGWTTGRKHQETAGGWAGSLERKLLAASVLLGLLCFLVQGKAYPYQRYPYVAFLLLFLGVEFSFAVRRQTPALRLVGAAGFVFGVLFCAPSFLRGAARAQWHTPVRAMEAAIRAEAGGNLKHPDGQVQCLDVVSGCTDALLHLHLREATGTIYDEFLFPQTPSRWGLPYTGPVPGAPVPRAVALGRANFQAELERGTPPRLILLSAWLFPQGPGDYRELALWPWFERYLREHYTLRSEQSFPRAENGPMGFRVYVRRFH